MIIINFFYIKLLMKFHYIIHEIFLLKKLCEFEYNKCI